MLQLAAGLTGSVGGGKINSGQAGSNGSFFSPAVSSFMNQQNPDVGDRPKAFLNWLFLDEQFNYQSTNGSGAEPVDAISNHYKTYARIGGNAIPVKQSGYVYIYTSNESSVAAFFDNLDVNHVQGPLLEETHYYPFGLTMAGISSKAAGKLENRFKFNHGTELTNDLDLSLYETPHRGYDPQVGRFWQVDQLAAFSVDQTPYHFGSNNPVLRNDPSGLIDTAANQSRPVILENVIVQPKPKQYSGVNWLNWPSYGGKTGKELQAETNTQLARKRDGLPYLPYGDTTFYDRAWEADQDWRTMSYGAVAALLAPFAIEGIITASPVIATESATLVNYGIRQASALATEYADVSIYIATVFPKVAETLSSFFPPANNQGPMNVKIEIVKEIIKQVQKLF